ncbi:MAG: HlyD family efflux transporter periplasmic adaptor subunit [Chromatiaceae bacterium]|nr:HlyD family efflux transporter periplasmic adaptor subunit [Chromatiaceae bacterium]
MNRQTLQSWLTLQCQAMPGAHAACARIAATQRNVESLDASWPHGEQPDAELNQLLEMALQSGGPVTSIPAEQPLQRPSLLRIAHPINHRGRKLGAIAVELTQVPRDQQAAVLRLIEWGNTWLELLFRDEDASEREADPLPQALQCILQSNSLQQAVMALTGYLAHSYACERVSLGWTSGSGIRVMAISDSSSIVPRSVLARQLRAAMMESMAQQRVVHWPTETPEQIPAHLSLARTEHDSQIMTLTLEDNGRSIAVLTFEAHNQILASAAKQQQIVTLARHLGPLLALKQTGERLLPGRIAQLTRNRDATPEQHGGRLKVLLLTSLLALGGYLLAGQAPHRISGSAQIEGAVQRALIAPFDGYVAAAFVRAGERVAAGSVMAELDDSELKLEQRQLNGEKIELEKQYRKALAGLDHAEARILKAQIAQAEARIDLVGQTLGRTRLRAPFSGVVVSGDLSRSLGKPVRRGEVLLELAPLDAYRVAIEIADQDISAIALGQHGTLILAARPGEKLALEVINITHMPIDEGNGFRVEARLSGDLESLRPGMRGVAKVEAGARSRFWIWTHEIGDWLGYRLWAWLP